MKFKFTTLIGAALFLIGNMALANEHAFDAKKRASVLSTKSSLGRSYSEISMPSLSANDNQYSVPGYTEEYAWDPDQNEWYHISNTTSTYDFNGLLLEEIVQEAETDYYLERTSYSYDEFGKLAEQISYVWGIDDWVPVSGEKTFNTYNVNGQLNGYIQQTMQFGEWMNESREVYILNGFGIPTEIISYGWSQGGWSQTYRLMDIVWNDWAHKVLQSYTTQFWNSGEWTNSSRYIGAFQGKNYTAITENWNNGVWVKSTRETYTLNNSKEVLELANFSENAWIPEENYETTFDAKGNPISFLYNIWDGLKWLNEMQFLFDLAYNENSDLTQMLLRYQDMELANPVNMSKYVYSSFLYFTPTKVTHPQQLENVLVFPNPVQDVLQIQIPVETSDSFEVTLSNLSGQVMYQETFTEPSIEIYAGKLAAGMYVLRIQTNNNAEYSTKIVKK